MSYSILRDRVMCQPVRASRVGGSRHTICRAKINALAAMAMSAVFLLPFSFPAEAQHIICCNSLIDVKGKWAGALRNCAGELAKLSEPERVKACETLSKAAPFPGAVCETAAPCYTACDQEALERAKAEYRKWLEVYQSLRANADALNDEASRVAREGEKLFADYFAGAGRTAMLKILGLISKQASRSARVYTNPGNRDAVIKDAVSIFRDLATVIKGGKWKGAVPVAEVIAMLMDLGFANAKMLTLLGEFDLYAKEAAKAADAALDALKKARAAKEKVDELEAKCRDSESSTSPPKEEESEDDEYKPTGQREYEAALKLRESWKRIDAGYVDTQGNWHDASSALQRALEIIQNGEMGAAEQSFRRVALALDNTVAGVQAQNAITEQKAIKAGNLMSVGFGKEARALGAFQRVLADLARIKEMTASRNAGPKPAPR